MSQRKRVRAGITTLLAFLTIVGAQNVLAMVTLSFDPLDFDSTLLPAPGPDGFNVGETTLVEVLVSGIEDPSGLISFQLALQYDPLTIEIFDPNSGFNSLLPLGDEALCSTIRGATCSDSSAFLTSTGRTAIAVPIVDDPVAGIFTFGYATAGTAAGPVGDGALAILGVKRISEGSANISFNTTDNPLTRIILGSGEVEFETETLPVQAVPIPTAGVLVFGAVTLISVFRRQK